MKHAKLIHVTMAVCIALLVLGVNPLLAGATSGGHSHRSNAFGTSSWSSYYTAPAYYATPVYVVPAAGGATMAAITGGLYYAPEAAPGAGHLAVLAVHVPANADVWLNDYKTRLTGRDREYGSSEKICNTTPEVQSPQ